MIFKCLPVALLSAFLLLTGCATAPIPNVMTHKDEVSGLRTDILGDNFLESGANAREMLWLNASRVFRNNRAYDYYLEVQYAARGEAGPLDIYPGNTLTVVADGKELKFGGIGSVNSRKEKDGIVTEDAFYKVTAGDIRAIATAREVSVRVTGKNGLVVRRFSAENFSKFQEFQTVALPSNGR